MSLPRFTFTNRATPWLHVGVGDVRTPTGTATWDSARWDATGSTWSGIEPTWLDVSCEAFVVRCEYGRQRSSDRFVPGVASIEVSNASGWADPNATGDFAALTMRPGRAIRFGVDHVTLGRVVLWRGFIDSVVPTYEAGVYDRVTLQCVDALGEVNRVKLAAQPESVDGETVSARMAYLLNVAKWPPTKTIVEPSAIPLIAADLNGQLADLLGRTADSGGGAVYGDREARIVSRARDWQTFPPGTPVEATIGNVGTGEPGYTIPGAAGYLTPTVGTVTTPDPGPLPADCTFVYKVRNTASPGQSIVGQFTASPYLSWVVTLSPDQEAALWIYSTTGSGYAMPSTYMGPLSTVDELYALAVSTSGGFRALRWIGGAWTETGRNTAPLATPFDTSTVMRVGTDGFGQIFLGRIYSVELRTGLDPATTGRYLTPTVGTVTTPDPGPLPATFCVVATVCYNLPTAGNATLAGQFDAGIEAWLLRTMPNGDFLWNVVPQGSQPQVPTVAPTGTDQHIAFAYDPAVGDCVGYTSANGSTWTETGRVAGFTVPPRDTASSVRVGAWGGGEPLNGRIYSVEMRTGLDPAAGTVVWRFDADEAPTDATTTTWTDPRGRTWTVTNPQAISGRTLWRFDADEYPGTGTSYTDPRGRTWTLTSAAAITPKEPDVVVPPVPADVCPVAWRRPFDRADIATRTIMGRDFETANVRDDTVGQAVYGIEPFERTDLWTQRDTDLGLLADRALRIRSWSTAPVVRAVELNAATSDGALDLMATADPYKPSHYRCRLELDRGLVFDDDHLVTGVVHELTSRTWTTLLNLDLAAPFEAAGGRWDSARWDRSTWTTPARVVLDELHALRDRLEASA